MSACKEPEIYLHDIHIHVRSISAKCTQGYQDILNIIYSRYTQKKYIEDNQCILRDTKCIGFHKKLDGCCGKWSKIYRPKPN